MILKPNCQRIERGEDETVCLKISASEVEGFRKKIYKCLDLRYRL